MGEAITMGTNFFWREKFCGECGRFDEKHVGKRSGGWSFTFREHEGIRSRADWVAYVAKGEGGLIDEYGREYAEPVAWLNALQAPDAAAIAWEDNERGPWRSTNRRDAEGFTFLDCEFS
jgi:hypothetical protein